MKALLSSFVRRRNEKQRATRQQLFSQFYIITQKRPFVERSGKSFGNINNGAES
ncbi:MAG: hypothetical protein IKN72_09040 [Clostridia bacterium]|nr:hypothetical protein [Clostridia bacterium]